MDSRTTTTRLLFILLVSEVVLILPEICLNVKSKLDSGYLATTNEYKANESSCKRMTGSGNITKPPNLVLLQQPPLRLLERIVDYEEFGTQLLEDETGDIVPEIEQDEKKTKKICREIFRRWLDGKGKQPVTWATLINVLTKSN